MIKAIASYLGKSKKIAGLEIIQIKPDEFIYNVSISRQKGKSLIIESEKEYLNSLNEVLPYLKSYPIALTYSGYNVLYKCTTINEKLIDSLGKIDEDDFIISSVQLNELTHNWLARKSVIEKLLEKFQIARANIVKLNIGPVDAINLYKQEHQTSYALKFGIHRITLSDEAKYELIQEGKDNLPRYISLGGEKINENCYTSATTAISYQLKLPLLSSTLGEIDLNGETKLFQFAFINLGWIFLGLVFCSLIVNTLWYLNSKSVNEELLAKTSALSIAMDRHTQLNDTIEAKLKLIKETGWANKYQTSFLLDQIGKCTPENLLLTRLNVNPIRKRNVVENNYNEFEYEKVIIEGVVINSLDLNRFNNDLLALKWISTSKIIEYKIDQLSNNTKFKIEVSIKNR